MQSYWRARSSVYLNVIVTLYLMLSLVAIKSKIKYVLNDKSSEWFETIIKALNLAAAPRLVMASRAIIITFFVTLACLVHVQAIVVQMKSNTLVRDGNNTDIAKLSINATFLGGGNKTQDVESINSFVESQLTKLLKNPERFAVKNNFGLRSQPPPPPPQPPGELEETFHLNAYVKSTDGSNKAYLNVSIVLETRGHKHHEGLLALKGPAFFAR